MQPQSDEYSFSTEDLQVLKENGISLEDAQRQLKLLKQPPYLVKLDRSCTLEDGINLIDDSEHTKLLALHEKAQNEGRFTKFVPASGAASRMFRDLQYFLELKPRPARAELIELAKVGSMEAKSVIKFLANINHFAFHNLLQSHFKEDLSVIKNQDNYTDILEILLTSKGLNYAELPKGLLPFNNYNGEVRTAFEEHLVEAARTIKDKNGKCKIHFTVSKEHLVLFEKLFADCREKLETKYSAKFEVSFSLQKNSTNMLSLGSDKLPFHDENGRLMLRPGGHGSLIENLKDIGGDLVFIKNIDNVQHDDYKNLCLIYKRILSGFLIESQQRLFKYLERLEDGAVDEAAFDEILKYARNELSIYIPSSSLLQSGSAQNRHQLLFKELNRPIRVCGMVRNTGEPGGGPFWIFEKNGSISMQIVEGAQVNLKDPEQYKIFNSSTHFNPVDIVCGLKDFKGKSFDLAKFINQEAIIKTKKSYKGRDLIACERPGLWNGSMSGWITLFVDVPESTFTPVKTVLDFLRK
jgi:hypothetical protein